MSYIEENQENTTDKKTLEVNKTNQPTPNKDRRLIIGIILDIVGVTIIVIMRYAGRNADLQAQTAEVPGLLCGWVCFIIATVMLNRLRKVTRDTVVILFYVISLLLALSPIGLYAYLALTS